MKVVQILPGAGDTFYCENCLRDSSLLKTLRESGHDVVKVPLYLPVMAEEMNGSTDVPLFFGGINVFLQQKSGFFRKTPRWIDRLFDAPPLLRWASQFSGMTRAVDLAETTLSMLRGEEGKQAKELDRLIDWLNGNERADIVHLSNSLLLGLAKPIKSILKVPIVCSLQDEDIFIDPLPEPYRTQVWELLKEQSKHVDAFITPSDYYKSFMSDRLELPENKVHTIHNGLFLEDYRSSKTSPEIPTIGFMERQCEEKGFQVLTEAFFILKKRNRVPNVRLAVAGGQAAEDKGPIRRIKKKLAHNGILDDVTFQPNLTKSQKQQFLQSLTVLSVPAVHKEAFGIYVLEALASGVPVVQPNHGAFTELIATTEGGILYEPNEPHMLAQVLETLLLHPHRIQRLGEQGRKNAAAKFDIKKSTDAFLKLLGEMALNKTEPTRKTSFTKAKTEERHVR